MLSNGLLSVFYFLLNRQKLILRKPDKHSSIHLDCICGLKLARNPFPFFPVSCCIHHFLQYQSLMFCIHIILRLLFDFVPSIWLITIDSCQNLTFFISILKDLRKNFKHIRESLEFCWFVTSNI